MNHSLSPKYLIDLLPTHRHTRYNLRTANNIPRITATTQMYTNLLLPETVRIWNNLPLSVSNHPSLTSFDQSLNSNMEKPKSIFSFESHSAQILHTRLRLDCSSLNFDLHRRSIVDSPLYVAVGRSKLSTTPLLADIRLRFLSDMPCPPILQNLLFGNENPSTDQNKVIFSRVQDCIISSRRFG